MKKLAIFCMALVMGFALLAMTSCNRNKDVELTIGWWGGDFRAELTHQVIDLFLEQNDNVEYVHRTIGSWGEYWDMMGTLAAGGDLPDIMQQDVSRLLEYAANGLLLDLTPYINDHRIDLRNISPSVAEAGRLGNEIVGVSLGSNVAAMVYNKSLLDGLGLSAPRNMTLDQFIQLSRDIYRLSGVRTNWVSTDPANPMEAHLRAQGVNLFEGNRLGGSADHYVDYFEVIRLGMEEGWHIRPEHLAGRSGAEQNVLWYPPGDENANLRAWNSLVWSNMVMGYINDSPADMEINMTTYPSRDPGRANFGRASMFFSITTQSDNPDEAAEFINFFLNSVEANQIMLGERGVIPNNQIRNTLYDQLAFGAQFQTEFVGWVNSPGNSSPFNPTRPEGAGEVLAELLAITELVHFGELTPQEAANRFFTNGNAILAR